MRGFTLIELSVVLTIFALIAGGVLAGKSVMEAAKAEQSYRGLPKIQAGCSSI